MPWTVADVDEHRAGLTSAQKRTWVAIANAALSRCNEEGGRECDALAIKRANGAMEEVMSKQEQEQEEIIVSEETVPEEEPQVEATEAEITGDVVTLVEAALDSEGVASIKLIQPGWGSSGYYSPKVLERDGPQIFTAGTKMFWDHATLAEERERPEGSLNSLAGEFVTDAHWVENGADGPGLYADAKVFKSHQEAVSDMAKHIGVSIRAMGKAKEGKAEGRKGPIIAELSSAKSVDFVTMPGAGGKVLELFESYRNGTSEQEPEPTPAEEPTVTEQEAQELRDKNAELTAEVGRLNEALMLNAVSALVTETLAGIEMPEPTRVRLAESMRGQPVITDGELDAEATATAIQEAAQAELAYLASVNPSGEIRGMGGSPPAQTTRGLVEVMTEHWLSQGKGPEEAKQLAEIAAKGR